MTTRRPLVVPLILLATAIVLAVALLLLPPWTSPDGVPWSLLRDKFVTPQDPEVENRLSARRLEVAQWRTQAKREVVIETLQGQLTLLEAASWFRLLDNEPPDLPQRRLPRQENPTPEDYCREVLRWAAVGIAPTDVTNQEEKVHRLKVALRHLLSRPNTIVLDKPPQRPFRSQCPEMG